MKTIKNLKNVFKGIVSIQHQFQEFFQKAGIFLKVATVCNDEELPSFDSSISDATGSSLDIRFVSTKNQSRLSLHLFNKDFFMITVDERTSEMIELKRLQNKEFLNALKKLFNKKYKKHKEWSREVFDFMDEFGRTRF